MTGSNQTSFTDFVFAGLTEDFKLQCLVFVIFTLIYVFTLLGNIGIFALIWTDPQLQTPMYYFLSNLALADLCWSSTVTPKMLDTIFPEKKAISFSCCASQLFFFAFFGGGEICLLSVMAYDRYVAICHPLLYPVIINQRKCVHLVCASYFLSFLNALVQVTMTFTLSFCRSNVIDHFFCDLVPLLKLSCSDTSLNSVVLFVAVFLFGMGSFGIILSSYSFIISTILSIRSTEGRTKAFSTCASHFTVVSLYFGTIFLMYFRPTSSSMAHNYVLSLFYTVVIPMLNPMIYSLRNKDIKKSIEKRKRQRRLKMNAH